MLTELRVRHYAVIEDVRIEPGPGLTVITGETGAGKSILIEAVSLLLGERASSELVRRGENRALVEGVFDVSDRPDIEHLLEEAGIETDDGGLILRRELRREGRNRVWVGGSPATAALMRDLGAKLIDLHGQHDHQMLLRRSEQRTILDAFAGASDVARDVAELHARARQLEKALRQIRERRAALEERAELLRFQVEEIEGAELEPEEEEELLSEARRLEHSEELLSLSSSLYEAVYGAEDALVERLGSLKRPFSDLLRLDPRAGELRALAEQARVSLEELGRRLVEYRERVEHDPHRLAGVRSRLDLLYRLKSKYGGTLEEVIARGRRYREDLRALEEAGNEEREAERERAGVRRRLHERAEELGRLRQEGGRRLAERVNALLPQLGMEGGCLEVAFDEAEEPTAYGRENPEFRVALNPGFPAAPLARVASGGELSRIMLALRTVLADVDSVPSLIFDEIDSGIGGRVAQRVGERLAEVAARRQVLTVTHLPQIAAWADTHLVVEKEVRAGRTAVRVRTVDGPERVLEITRMLGGEPGDAAARRHAEKLLSQRKPAERAVATP